MDIFSSTTTWKRTLFSWYFKIFSDGQFYCKLRDQQVSSTTIVKYPTETTKMKNDWILYHVVKSFVSKHFLFLACLGDGRNKQFLPHKLWKEKSIKQPKEGLTIEVNEFEFVTRMLRNSPAESRSEQILMEVHWRIRTVDNPPIWSSRQTFEISLWRG